MRLILCHKISRLRDVPQPPDQTFVFLCREDFSVGPLADWDDRETFERKRSEFWNQTPVFDLPDGEKMAHSIWYQALPHHDLVELVQSGVAIEDIPLDENFNDLLPNATEIEIWCDQSVAGQLFQWYLGAVLPRRGIDPSIISICQLPSDFGERRPAQFWSEVVFERQVRECTKDTVSAEYWQRMKMCWDTVTRLPAAIDPSVLRNADTNTLHTFEVLRGRYPSDETGQTNLQDRVLRSTTATWKRSMLTVFDALVLGVELGDDVAEGTLQTVLYDMTAAKHPLIEKKGAGAWHKSEVRLTTLGKRTLNRVGD